MTTPKGHGTPVRAARYIRVSRSDQHPELQADSTEALIAQRGYELVETFTDLGVSGARQKRPALDRLMEGARQGRFRVVIVYRCDRLFRSLKHMVNALSELASFGCELVSVTEPAFDSTTNQGRLMLHLSSAFAEFERGLLQERTRAGMAAARRRGARIGRPRKTLNANEVRKMRRDGVSLQDIARKLNVGKTTVQRFVSRMSGDDLDDGPEGGSDPDTYYAPICPEVSG